MDPSDKQLIDLVLGGEADAYSQLIDRYKDALFRHCFLLLWDEFEAEDVAQETFIAAYHKLSSYDASYAFSTWLFTIARHKGLTVLSSKRLKFRVQDFDLDTVQSSHNTPQQSVEMADVRQAVACLPEKYRAIVVMHYWQGLQYKDIATVMHTTEGTIKGQMSRAKELLRKELL